MSTASRRTFLASGLMALTLMPFSGLRACLWAGDHATILFDDLPENIPEGLTAKHFHLTNQVEAFEEWRAPRKLDFTETVDMRFFSFIGVGAEINPWTNWLINLLPDWMTPKRDYVPVFAPTSSCTSNFQPFEDEVDMDILLVGRTLHLITGEKAFCAASYRPRDGRWDAGFLRT